MHRDRFAYCALALACFAASIALAAPAAAQSSACPPGQPCVIVQTPEASGYVTVQPVVQPQQQVVYAAPVQQQPRAVEVTRTRLRWGLIGPGIGLLVGGWFANWITGAVGTVVLAFHAGYDTSAYFGWSWIPIVGPWVNAAIAAPESDALMGFHILWGILQAGGLLMCILGTALPEEHTELQYVDRERGIRVAVLPWADAQGAGAAVGVTF